MSDCCLIKKVATVEVYENKNEVRAYGFMAGDKNTPMMEVKFKHLWGEENLSKCKLRWIIVDDLGSLLVGEVPIEQDNTASIQLPNELFTGERRMKVQLTVASCDGNRILNLQQFTDLKVINNLASNEVVEPVYQMLINQVYDDTKKYLAELETSYKAKYGSLESVYAKSKASLEQYLINAENGGNAEFLQGYTPAMFQKVESTIADLKASSKYNLGDVVEVLGYYTAGDGAHHKRIAKSEDDGSGVQLANGLWANIVHDNEVNVSWFGNSFAFVDYSNQQGNLTIIMDRDLDITSTLYFNKEVKVKWKSGTITSSVNLDTVIEFGDRNIKIDETQGSIDWHTQKHYSIEGCVFKNITTDKLIKINTGVTEPIIKNNTFVNIIPKNAPDSTVLYLGKSIWYGVVSDNNYSGETNVRLAKFLFNESYGNTLLKITNNLITSLNGINEVAIDIDAGHSLIFNNKIEGWMNNVRIGTESTGIRCINNYFEMSGNGKYGNFEIIRRSESSKTLLEMFEISENYCNLRNVIGSDYKSFINFKQVGCIKGLVEKNFLNNYTLVANRTNGYITSDGSSCEIVLNDNVLVSTIEPLYLKTNINKARGNQSTENFSVKVGDFNLVYDEFSLHNKIFSKKFYRFFKDGRVGFGRDSIDANYHFNGDIRAKFLRVDEANTHPSEVPNCSLFMYQDQLFYKNNLGNSYKLTPTSITTLDTPYYTLKMQEQGIYEDYVAYRDELHEYENSQTSDDTMLLPILQEPVIPESVKAFAEKYKLI